jgi:Uma2 family endonuclease
MSALPIVTGITPEEYLERERAAEFKSEYHCGRIYAMAGTSYRHSVILVDFIRELGNALRGTHCRGSVDLRVRIAEDHYVYPDIVVVCDDAKLADDQMDTLLNPRLLIEVLSHSTEAYDRGYKAEQYRKLESLKEYVFVSQSDPHVEIIRRSSEGWVLTEHKGLDSVCRLESIGRDLRLAGIYENVTFSEATG